ncbi:MAG: UDP-N-acetylglucosamine--N-acetylmuramyl-(pentapeptide) pyrophosphoryl-undecaprenol N-acetylglucosamine transferase [Tepidiformaceae bacterium]
MKLALTAGGTGGHILPALAVLDAVLAAAPATDVRFFGPEDRGERASIEARGLHFEGVPAAGVRGRGPMRLAKSVLRLGWGSLVALRKLWRFRPDAVFSTGGYGSFPCSLAARVLRRPLVVFLPDVSPGWAVRAEKRLATRMATTTAAALAHLPARETTVTGYPVRQAFFSQSREQARAALGIAASERVLLVAGATQGARAINDAVFGGLGALLPAAIVFHITGHEDEPRAAATRGELAPSLAARYHPTAFRDDLPALMLAADLGVMRAGASTLGELPAAALPSILVPGTYAGGHQRDNARWLAAGDAALVLEEAALDTLTSLALELLGDDERLARMAGAAAGLARPDAAAAIAGIILEVARR